MAPSPEDADGAVSVQYGAPGEIRTPDHLVRSQVLYPAELRARGSKKGAHPITRYFAAANKDKSSGLKYLRRSHARVRFNSAIVRTPASSVVDGLRADYGPPPDLASLEREHAAYIAALRAAGLAVAVLRRSNSFRTPCSSRTLRWSSPAPRSTCFAPERPAGSPKAAELLPLSARFPEVLRLDQGFADGGDILVTPREIVIGLSARADVMGAAATSGTASVHRPAQPGRLRPARRFTLKTKLLVDRRGDHTGHREPRGIEDFSRATGSSWCPRRAASDQCRASQRPPAHAVGMPTDLRSRVTPRKWKWCRCPRTKSRRSTPACLACRCAGSIRADKELSCAAWS